MPVLGFKKQFVQPILAGTKVHTIRAPRKHPVKVCQRLYFYTGVRTKDADKFGEAICSKIQEIEIVTRSASDLATVAIDKKLISRDEKLRLVHADGFASEMDFSAFFRSNYGYRFIGQLIHWKEFVDVKKALQHLPE